jgi:tRNA-guanine family transglycosylase
VQRENDGVSAANSNVAADTAATAAGQLLFRIVQGATFEDLRRSSVQAIVDLGLYDCLGDH